MYQIENAWMIPQIIQTMILILVDFFFIPNFQKVHYDLPNIVRSS